MLNFDPLRAKTVTMAELTRELNVADLRTLTHDMIDRMQQLIAGCTDADVVFQPIDPDAHDERASSAGERDLAWTLPHVIAHTTASAEESAFLAAELARGIPLHGRSRFETPWESLQTISSCHERLEESRRIRIASLDLWPARPHLDVLADYSFLEGSFDARGRFAIGLWHDDSHLKQIAEIVRQACAARGEAA